MDFTREPIIETVITPKEGFKLVVRSSKSVSQEEYFVDAIEVVSFGNAFFFRSLEKPKAFLVPVSDYEILEVREARIVLKNVGTERAIKIGGGREGIRHTKEMPEKLEPITTGTEATVTGAAAEAETLTESAEPARAETKMADGRGERKRERRRHYRRRRGRDDETREPAAAATSEEEAPLEEGIPEDKEGKIILQPPAPGTESPENLKATSSLLSSLLTPPPQLISETIERYKSNALFKGAFYEREEFEREEAEMLEVSDIPTEEEAAEEPFSQLSWEFTPESESPTSTFSEEEVEQPDQDLSENETMELPPDPQSKRE